MARQKDVPASRSSSYILNQGVSNADAELEPKNDGHPSFSFGKKYFSPSMPIGMQFRRSGFVFDGASRLSSRPVARKRNSSRRNLHEGDECVRRQ